MQITSAEIRQKYLDFFKSKNHAILESAPLVPENDPSVLFNTAGMQPLVPYLLGEKHSMGTRLADVQKCVRTGDIDEIGDNTHLSFFEMLGNWSLGDYFKKESIEMSYELLTSKEWFGINPEHLAVTVFEGDENAPRDEESASIWKSLGIPESRISYMGARDNWWAAGPTGPCGPDTEIFYWVGEGEPRGNVKENESEWMEIWNNVFMEFNKLESGKLEKLPAQNVDTGMGLERITRTLNKKDSVYSTDIFADVIEKIRQLVGDSYMERSARIIADHLRAATMMISDGVVPKNVDQGYILRRLIRRAIREFYKMGYEGKIISEIGKMYIEKFSNIYVSVKNNSSKIIEELDKEEEKFGKMLKRALRVFIKETYTPIEIIGLSVKTLNVLVNSDILSIEELLKLSKEDILKLRGSGNNTLNDIENSLNERGLKLGEYIEKDKKQYTGEWFFDSYQEYGFPFEMMIEELESTGTKFSKDEINNLNKEFKIAFEKHQELSRTASEGKFKGGLAGGGEMETKYHTATHMLLAGLRKVLGEHVFQAGSNITEERLRFDFTHSEKVTPEQLVEVENFVNDIINSGAKVELSEMKKDEAKSSGIVGSFWEKYPEIVKIYTIKGNNGEIYSRELCGGPHAETISKENFGTFKIQKEEASSSGVRRIKAVLQ